MGKTTILDALYRTKPIGGDAVFDEAYDYPKREVEDYRFAVENGEREEAIVVECLYELDDEDLLAVQDVFGPKALKGSTDVGDGGAKPPSITKHLTAAPGRERHRQMLPDPAN